MDLFVRDQASIVLQRGKPLRKLLDYVLRLLGLLLSVVVCPSVLQCEVQSQGASFGAGSEFAIVPSPFLNWLLNIQLC